MVEQTDGIWISEDQIALIEFYKRGTDKDAT